MVLSKNNLKQREEMNNKYNKKNHNYAQKGCWEKMDTIADIKYLLLSLCTYA